jgi:hypothetical protein
LSRGQSIVGRRAGTLVVESVDRKHMIARCDCGVVCRKPSSYIYRDNPNCGDTAAHPRVYATVHGLSGDYRGEWHRKHKTCAGWTDAAVFATAIGERPEGHGLAIIGDDVARCGTCGRCVRRGVARNVRWIKGARVRGTPVLCGGEWVNQAEAARRLGTSRQAVADMVARGTGDVEPSST